MRKLPFAVIALLGLAGAAHADSIDAIQINGAIGGAGGYHTVVVDGVTCKLKNSTMGGGQGAGCNYTLSGGISGQGQGSIKASTGNAGCSMSCQ